MLFNSSWKKRYNSKKRKIRTREKEKTRRNDTIPQFLQALENPPRHAFRTFFSTRSIQRDKLPIFPKMNIDTCTPKEKIKYPRIWLRNAGRNKERKRENSTKKTTEVEESFQKKKKIRKKLNPNLSLHPRPTFSPPQKKPYTYEWEICTEFVFCSESISSCIRSNAERAFTKSSARTWSSLSFSSTRTLRSTIYASKYHKKKTQTRNDRKRSTNNE